ncbi:MAG: PmoA family protein [Candidatus Hydrogenedentes bacterium]|nr:PmoA family protein [Candidatus Hydrogenedentota bacterium]
MRTFLLSLIILSAGAVQAELALNDDGTALTLLEGGKPVWVYHYTFVQSPDGVPPEFYRACYFHPLYGLDSEVLTQDFPNDHYHHRGVFWGWPDSTWGEEKLDIWAIGGVRQVHENWITKEVEGDTARLAMTNLWVYDAHPGAPVLREHVEVVTHTADAISRSMDFTVRFENISDKPIVIRGATTDDKGYGGFNFRPDKTRKPFVFTTPQGVAKEDALEWKDAPWIDISYNNGIKGSGKSGVAIFQHPELPGYVHQGWILRDYGFLGQSWPHRTPYEIKPGESVTLKHRLYIHRGGAKAGKVKQAHEAYLKSVKP